MLAGGASDREHIVERHRDIGDNDLPGGPGEGLAGRWSRHTNAVCAGNSQELLMLLALGTFLAGIKLLSLQICFLGLAMADELQRTAIA